MATNGMQTNLNGAAADPSKSAIGEYEKTIKLLEAVKNIPGLRAEELQALILKLKGKTSTQSANGMQTNLNGVAADPVSYEEAIKLLEALKNIPGSKAEELQALILRLKGKTSTQSRASYGNTMPTTSTSDPTVLRQRNKSQSQTQADASQYKSYAEYDAAQLTLVKHLKNCKSFYEILGVTRYASDAQIRKSYKKLALQLHPDKNRAPGAAEAFKLLGNAWSVLSDVQKRKEYDAAGATGLLCNNGYVSTQRRATKYQHQQYYSEHTSYTESFFRDDDDLTAEDLFHMFFGNQNTQQQRTHYRQRTYQSANQRQPQENANQQPSMAFGFILILILISMLTSLFASDPIYSLAPSNKYSVQRKTQHLSVTYYVKEKFINDYHGSLARLENSVEEDYIYTMKQNCLRERNYREALLARARSFGSRVQYAQAQEMKMPSCDNLSRLGIKRYSLY